MSSKSSVRSGRGRGSGKGSGKSLSTQNITNTDGFFVTFEVVLVIVLLIVAIVLIVFLNRKFNTHKENLVIDEGALKRMERFQNGPPTGDQQYNSKPVKKLHVFYAKWCGHSRRYLSTVHQLLNERLTTEGKVDYMIAHDVETESGAAAAELVKVRTLPSFYIETYIPVVPEEERNPNRFRKIVANQPTPQTKVDFLMSQL